MRTLAVVLGDQLDRRSAIFEDWNPNTDAIWMAEVAEESTHVPSHPARIALFLSAMRHFRDELESKGFRVYYRLLDDKNNPGSLSAELKAAIAELRPERIICIEPGDYRVRTALLEAVPALEILPDRHFLCSLDQFNAHAHGRKQLRLEYFYREMRRAHGVLMDGNQPAGGEWNYDSENRAAFGKQGPGTVPPPLAFPPDRTTRDVLALVRQRFASHAGSLDHFSWPVTPAQARAALDDFITHRLPFFGAHQDAMWTNEPFLYHSRISAALNLKLLDPREAIAAAENAYRRHDAPLAAVEGFIRQILGWREFVHHVHEATDGFRTVSTDVLGAGRPLPPAFWGTPSGLHCLDTVVADVWREGWSHHITRLMVLSNLATLLDLSPRELTDWFWVAYVDAFDWVVEPNVLAMGTYATGPLMTTKPYVSGAAYIARMSDYCRGCRFDPATSCPITRLYWAFLARHEAPLVGNPRMAMPMRSLAKRPAAARREDAETFVRVSAQLAAGQVVAL